MEIEFNLLEEPWIRVMTDDCAVRECSLTEALLDSHRYRRLAGELPTQDVAVLRLLLAVLHSVFYRVDPEGKDEPIEDRMQAVLRWQALWDAKRLPEQPIRDYLGRWKDRFWLFHPECPFYQVPGAEAGTKYTAAKLNGELSESSNKPRLFPLRAGESKTTLSYAEAARWMLTFIGFDDAASVKKEIGAGAGWLGQHANLYAVGNTLFETLLLNLVFLSNGNELWEENNLPIWERTVVKEAKKKEIPVPDNQAELLTLQSRRTLLCRDNDSVRVVGCLSTGGDYFGKDGARNAFNEQMVYWRKEKEQKNAAVSYRPARVDVSKQMWRDYETIVDSSNGPIPGVIAWINTLKEKGCLKNEAVHLSSVGVTYDASGGSCTDIITDHLDFHISLLGELGRLWTALIQEKIRQTEKAAWLVGLLAEDLFKASGGAASSDGQKERAARKIRQQQAEQQYYAAVDIPFRKWLFAIDPEQGDDETIRAERDAAWRKEACRIALEQGKSMVRNAGEAAFTGRWIKKEFFSAPWTKDEFFSAPKEFNRFTSSIRACFQMQNLKKEESNGQP